jgi:hypothetical protein
MHDNMMAGLPREKINMAKNLKDMIICKPRPLAGHIIATDT